MRRSRRALGIALLLAAGVAAGLLGHSLRRHSASPQSTLEVSPRTARLSVRAGDALHFSVRAREGDHVAWSIWGRTVANGPSFIYTPAPGEAGWQNVTVVLAAADGRRASHTWDVGVVPPVAPELVEVEPSPGTITVSDDVEARFRVAARVPAARATDRLRFEWLLDGAPLHQEEQPAERGVSQLAVMPPSPGSHRLVVRVTENGAEASTAAWTIDVDAPPEDEPAAVAPAGTGAIPPAIAPAAPTPPVLEARAVAPDAASPAPRAAPEPLPVAPVAVPPPRLVRAPGSRRLEVEAGEHVPLRVGVTPEDARARYAWTVDGAPVRGAGGELGLDVREPGTTRVAVRVSVEGREVGHDAWIVTVRAPATPEPPATVAAVSAAPLPPAGAPSTTTETVAAGVVPVGVAPDAPGGTPLVEADVRRWLDEYARAWSRKDTAALRRMGQVRSAAEAAQLERYFGSVEQLQVDVRVRTVRVDGERAAVEFERVDTVTDPGGRRQELRLPPLRKEIERTPDGMRFVAADGAG